MRKLWPTLACCVLVTLFVSRRGAGPMLVYVLPFILTSWLLLVAYVAFRRKELRRLQLAKAAIWVVGVATAASAHAYMYEQARQDALRVSTAAEAFKVAKGRYPCSISELGFEETDARQHRHLANLYCVDGGPHLWYFSTFRPYEMEEYDFQVHRWTQEDASPD
jgi:hypothetical protein